MNKKTVSIVLVVIAVLFGLFIAANFLIDAKVNGALTAGLSSFEGAKGSAVLNLELLNDFIDRLPRGVNAKLLQGKDLADINSIIILLEIPDTTLDNNGSADLNWLGTSHNFTADNNFGSISLSGSIFAPEELFLRYPASSGYQALSLVQVGNNESFYIAYDNALSDWAGIRFQFEAAAGQDFLIMETTDGPIQISPNYSTGFPSYVEIQGDLNVLNNTRLEKQLIVEGDSNFANVGISIEDDGFLFASDIILFNDFFPSETDQSSIGLGTKIFGMGYFNDFNIAKDLYLGNNILPFKDLDSNIGSPTLRFDGIYTKDLNATNYVFPTDLNFTRIGISDTAFINQAIILNNLQVKDTINFNDSAQISALTIAPLLLLSTVNGISLQAATNYSIIINDLGRDSDFRIESDNNQQAILVDASTNETIIHNLRTTSDSNFTNIGVSENLYMAGGNRLYLSSGAIATGQYITAANANVIDIGTTSTTNNLRLRLANSDGAIVALGKDVGSGVFDFAPGGNIPFEFYRNANVANVPDNYVRIYGGNSATGKQTMTQRILAQPGGDAFAHFATTANLGFDFNSNTKIAGDLNVLENINADGNIHSSEMLRQHTTWHVYGGFQDQTEVIPCIQNEWTKVAAWPTWDLWQGLEADGITMIDDNMHIFNAGDYVGTVTMSMSGANGNDYFLRIYNTAQDTQVGFYIGSTMSGVNNFIDVTMPIYIEAEANDTFQLQLMNITNNNNPIVRNSVFELHYLHD